MNAIFKKLNYKDQPQIYVINAPASFKSEMEEMKTATQVKTSLGSAKSVTFFLAFVTKQKEVETLTRQVAPLIEGDGVLWFAYPKGTSKKYTCEFNRDSGWDELAKHEFEPVRQVAIDEDWSALRFRKVEHIKTMTRSFARSEAGKKKVAATGNRKKAK